MGEKSVHERWLTLPWGICGAILAVIFGGIAVQAWFHPEEGLGIRMISPLYLFSAYWVLAALCNIRTTVITARDVRDVV